MAIERSTTTTVTRYSTSASLGLLLARIPALERLVGLDRLTIWHRWNGHACLWLILGHVAFYCIDEGLPALTSIVVGKGRGTPGRDIPLNIAQTDAERELLL